MEKLDLVKKKRFVNFRKRDYWEILLPLAYKTYLLLLILQGFDSFLSLSLSFLLKSRALPMNLASRNDPEGPISEDAFRLGFLH